MANNNLVKTDLQKLDLNILESSYEGLPKSMLRQGLSSYLLEAEKFVSIIDAARQPDTDQVVLCFHNLKTMSGMIGALDMVALCKNYEESTTMLEKKKLIRQLELEWSRLQIELQLLLQHENFNEAD